jgi:hypothetical protein
MSISAVAYIGEATTPNKVTGASIFIQWEAALVPLRECEGGGWYTKSRTETGWSFRWKPVHKGWFGSVLDDSTWNTASLEDLVEKAVREAHRLYCVQTTGPCRCGKGYVSRHDGKCGHCRTKREAEALKRKLRDGPQS